MYMHVNRLKPNRKNNVNPILIIGFSLESVSRLVQGASVLAFTILREKNCISYMISYTDAEL